MMQVPTLLPRAAAALALLLSSGPLLAQPFGQWDFNSSNLTATVGSDLQYMDEGSFGTQNATVFGTTTALGIPNINGAVATVMHFPANTNGMGLLIPTPTLANGGGELVNDYTLILDLLYPAASSGKLRALMECDFRYINPNAELFVGANNGIGSQVYGGQIQPNTWYRIGFVMSGSTGGIRKYINGVEVGSETGVIRDDRYALTVNGFAQLFTDDNGEVAAGYVNSIQLLDSALNSGQMLALGGPAAAGIPQVIPAVPSFILSRSPDVNATGVTPIPLITVSLKNGDTSISPGSLALKVDGVAVTPSITTVSDGFDLSYSVTNILSPQSLHSASLVWSDSVGGSQTNSWSFTISQYQNVSLPAPLYLETFDALAEASLPAGWVATNATFHQDASFNLDNPSSDAYLDFVVISKSRLETVFGSRRLDHNLIVLNGAVLDSLVHGNLLYADSDNRANEPRSQVNVIVTSDYDLRNKTNIFVSFFSSYEQNQDSLGALEYSINSGVTWLPIAYMLDKATDVLLTNGVVDVDATLNTARANQAYATNFSAFIAAPVSSIKPAQISGRIDDDSFESKRVETYRIAQADGQAKVRFRLALTGTSSWYWGIDDFGLYSINTPVLTQQPLAQKVDAGQSVTFSVTATINPPYTYQWLRNGLPIEGAQAKAQSYTINPVAAADAGEYSVVVKNSDGSSTSSAAMLTVVSFPEFVTQPQNLLVSSGWTATFSATVRGQQPMTYKWYRNGALLSDGSSSTFTLGEAFGANAGDYSVVAVNSYGASTSSVARLSIFAGGITNDLVVHLAMDNNYNDGSGRGNHATAVGSPRFVPGKVGPSAMQFTTAQDGSSFNYATLGNPADLNFGDTTDFTISYWVKLPPNSIKGDPAILGNKNWASGGNQGFIFFSTGPLRWNFKESTGPRADYNSGIEARDDQWHHFLVVFDRGEGARSYLDGVLRDTRSIGPGMPTIDAPASLKFNIGQDGTGTYTDGGGVGITNAVIDDLGIWRRALTSQEVASIYNAGLKGRDLRSAEGTALGQLHAAAVAGGSIKFTWTASPTARLQRAAGLANPAGWTDVTGTLGQGTTTIAPGTPAMFYRLYRP